MMTSSAAVRIVLMGPVMLTQASLRSLLSLAFVVVCLVLYHQMDAAEVSIGLAMAVYSQWDILRLTIQFLLMRHCWSTRWS